MLLDTLSPPAGDGIAQAVSHHEPELHWTILEATTRWSVHQVDASLKDGRSSSSTRQLLCLPISTAAARLHPLAAIQQPGMHITCLKSAAVALCRLWMCWQY
jgi:hypothetical protein